MSRHSIKTALITATVLFLATLPLQLAAESEPKSFKDWGYKCESPQGSDSQLCFIFQRISSKEGDKRIADATIAYLPKVEKPVMIITLPLGVFLPAGIKMQVDEAKDDAVRAPFVQCIQDGCQARVQLENKMVTKMKGGKKMIVAFLTPQQKQLAFPISLSGFTAAMGSLKK
jgi:invasion protein IalB